MLFTGADIRNGKYWMSNDSKLYTSVAGKYQAHANSAMVSIVWHHYDGKWNNDSEIQNEVV